MTAAPVSVGILCFPGVQQLDLTGPYEVFASAPEVTVRLIWKTLQLVRAATGLLLSPDTTFADDCRYDVICVPGGRGVDALLTDADVIAFIQCAGAQARFVTAVCTGALLLGRAGFLTGRRATTHWNALDFLPRFGGTAVDERSVSDGRIVTVGGVTSGIHFSLGVLAELVGHEEAETVQLMLQHAPSPPFDAGSVASALPEVVALARKRLALIRGRRLRRRVPPTASC